MVKRGSRFLNPKWSGELCAWEVVLMQAGALDKPKGHLGQVWERAILSHVVRDKRELPVATSNCHPHL